ncbi:hypothetical protein [Glycomyces rhizosphaerae]|uniref:DUF11 domain-containing protein n=1 Tax=Glycomyces rhizosphaerae TaxID=2054422 RepID=A0ABV7PWY6_9ACTN
MNTPDPMASIFAGYTDDTAAEVKGSSTGPLWRRARRRRIGRTAAAGVAALALIAPATWLLANAAGADEHEGPQAGQESATDEEGVLSELKENYLDELGPKADLVGTTLDLPSFVPGNADVDAVCGVDDAELGDGRYEEPVEDGAVFFVQSSIVLTEGGYDFYYAGLFGCRYGEETLYQAVVLDEVEDDTWAAGTQLVHSVPGGESPQHLPNRSEDGLVVGFAERYDPAADDLRYWAERITLDADGEPVREVLGELGPESYSAVSVEVAATETEEDGVWAVTVEAHNTGPRTLTDYVLTAATDPEVEILSGGPVNLRTDPLGTWSPVAEVDEIPVGGVFSYEWTVAVGEYAEPEYAADLPQIMVEFISAAPYDDLPLTAQTLGFYGTGGGCVFVE